MFFTLFVPILTAPKLFTNIIKKYDQTPFTSPKIELVGQLIENKILLKSIFKILIRSGACLEMEKSGAQKGSIDAVQVYINISYIFLVVFDKLRIKMISLSFIRTPFPPLRLFLIDITNGEPLALRL